LPPQMLARMSHNSKRVWLVRCPDLLTRAGATRLSDRTYLTAKKV
jgi:hypothetical protein